MARVAHAGAVSEAVGAVSKRADAAHIDAVEVALADAITRASRAEQWDVVAQLARELEARRKAHSGPNVVPIEAGRGVRLKGKS